MRIFFQLGWFFKQEKKAYITGVLLLLLVALLQLIPPKIIGLLADQMKNRTLTNSFLFGTLTVIIAAALLAYVFRYYWRMMIFGSAVKLSRLLRQRLYSHFTRMSPGFYQRHRIGDLMAHATNDLQAVQETAGTGVLTLVDSIFTGGSVIITMAFTISWKLTLICLIPMPFMAILTSWYGSMLHRTFHQAQAGFSSLNDKTQESILGIKVIKAFGQEQEDIADFRHESDDVVRKNIAVAKIDSLFDPTISLIVGISFFLSIAFGAKFVLAGELTIGQLISFSTYLGLLIWPMLAFGWLFNIMERGRASYDRVSLLLNEKEEIINHPEALNEAPSGDINYRIAEFSYQGGIKPVLQNIKFIIKRGETLGIVGKTGSGKTTMLKLLLREFEIDKGGIEIGGRPLKKYQIERLRSAFGYVPQDHFLFSASIAENISLSNPQAERTDIIAAAKIACIDRDIQTFTNGYETVVGERGVSLSGGQKQRISIARAMMMNPEILVLDDSLSAVDAETEQEILKGLKQSRQGKTNILTSHRLSAIQDANLILVLDNGKIIEKGTHQELMETGGWYKEMYLYQQLERLVKQGGEGND